MPWDIEKPWDLRFTIGDLRGWCEPRALFFESYFLDLYSNAFNPKSSSHFSTPVQASISLVGKESLEN